MMKIGFSSVVCPEWDLATMARQAKAYGYDGIELRCIQGEMNSALLLEWAAGADEVRRSFADLGIELICLSSSAAFGSNKKQEVADNKALARQYVELAARLGCPYVRVFAGEVPPGAIRQTVLVRIARALDELAGFAARHRVTLVVENSGDFSGSDAIWFLLDWVQHPAIRVCWNPCAARTANERPTISIPRLGTRIAMVHACDAKFDEQCRLQSYALPGRGDVEIGRMIQLLRGVGYDGYLIFDWPKMWVSELADPETALPAALEFLRKADDEKPEPLSAYKGDKKPVKFAPRPGGSPIRAAAG